MIIEKRHRLDMVCYKGMVRASFTLCIKDRKPVFTREDIVQNFTGIFEKCIRKYSCFNWIYLFMPDHFHFILEGKNLDANLWKATVLFKQKTGYWFSKNTPCIQWQKDFFDYVHRKESDLKEHVSYILDNPVRKEIVKNRQDYCYKGSVDLDLDCIVDAG
ncbi:MAG: transposase [Gammaproteobacteria bacterium]|nr:transposase [Gammaproteobacteria bacterium]